MKYIKGLEIIETPVYTEFMGTQITVPDEQLRVIGYKPIEEVVLEQADILSGMAPDAEAIKQKVMDSLTIKVQQLPYMIGFSWQTTIVDNEIRFKLVPDSNGLGTKGNPIIFAQYVLLVPNAHYFYENNIYKYKGTKMNADNWDSCKDFMELM